MTISHLSTPRPWVCRAVFSFVVVTLFAFNGCGGRKSCVVNGKVLVDDVPTEGVYVVFHTVSGESGQPDSGRRLADRAELSRAEQVGNGLITTIDERVCCMQNAEI